MLNINHEKELLRGLWVNRKAPSPKPNADKASDLGSIGFRGLGVWGFGGLGFRVYRV